MALRVVLEALIRRHYRKHVFGHHRYRIPRSSDLSVGIGNFLVAQLIVIALCVVAIIAAFFSAVWAWGVLAIPVVLLAMTFAALKQHQWEHIPELSDSANAMLQKYGHHYAMPFATRDFSAAATTIMFAGVVIAIIGAFSGIWWGLAVALTTWVTMGILSKAFNPTNFIVDPIERLAHEEVIAFIQSKQGVRRDAQHFGEGDR